MSETINFGIDLGTTNSAIAKFAKGRIEIFKDPSTGKDTLPSAVGFRKDRILTGNAARVFQERDPKNVVGQFKRKMGTTETYRIKSQGNAITPVDLSTHILKALKAQVQTGERVDAAVITIPASFDVIQSNATKQAGINAGFSEVVLIQEPIAASLAYANQTGSDLKDGRWLVYDLGGGTFDVALVNVVRGDLKIQDHEGDNNLGGSDFDRAIVANFIIPYIQENFEDVNLASDFQSASGAYNTLFCRLLFEAEKAKIALSSHTSSEIEFEFKDESVSIEITRSDLESTLREPIDRTVEMVRSIMTRNNLVPNDVNFVLMVGGSTYIPFVRQRVSELLGIPTKTDIDPTTAVAIGAAYFAGTKERSSKTEGGESKVAQRLSIKAVYEKATRECSELFAAKISGEIEGLFYQIRRKDGGFDTGLRQLTERISEDLTLVNDSYNYFTLYVYDGKNNRIEANLNEIQIAHNIYTIHGQPLPEDICLELDDMENETTYLEQIFAKGIILPAKSPPKTVKANRNVTSGSRDQALYINVYQGSSETLPESNKLLGRLSIHGTDVKGDIIKGSDIELRFEMSESEDVKVSAYIEHLEKSLSQVFTPIQRNVELDTLQLDLNFLGHRALREIDAARGREDEDLAMELRDLHKAIDLLEDKALELSDDDVTDQKLQFDDEMRRLAKAFNSAVNDRSTQKLLAEYFETRERCEDIINNSSNNRFREHFAEVVAGEKRFTNPPSRGILKTKIKELEGLYWHVRWRMPEFLTEQFRIMVGWEDDSTDSATYQNLIEDGQIALIDNNYDKLREIIFRMTDLLPPNGRNQIEGKTGIGL